MGLFHVDSNAIDDRCVNSTSSFRNYLASMYRYSDDKYEAGLLELHLPFSWINLSKGNFIGLFDNETGHLLRNGILPVREGYYHNLESLCDECNLVVRRNFYTDYLNDFFPAETLPDGGTHQPQPPDFLEYDATYRRVFYTLTTGRAGKAYLSGALDPSLKTVREMHARFTPQLAFLLGFDGHCFEYIRIHSPLTEPEWAQLNAIKKRNAIQYPQMKVKYELDFPEDLKTGVRSFNRRSHVIMYMSNAFDPSEVARQSFSRSSVREPFIQAGLEELFIYCSIIKHHAIGNSFKQLLRVTPVYPPESATRGQPIVLSYDRPFYFPLFDTSFDYIEIELRDRAGQLINFESGGVIAVIEVRRRKHGE